MHAGGESPSQKSDQNEPNISEKRARLEPSASIIIAAVSSRAENSAISQRESDTSSGGSGSTPIVRAAGTGSSSTSPVVAAQVALTSATASADQPPCAPSEPRPRVPARRTRTAFTRRQLECMESLFDAQPYPGTRSTLLECVLTNRSTVLVVGDWCTTCEPIDCAVCSFRFCIVRVDKLLFDQLSHVLALDERVLQASAHSILFSLESSASASLTHSFTHLRVHYTSVSSEYTYSNS